MEANRKMSFRVKVLGLSVATALLAACGGGGGSGTSNNTTTSASISGKAVDFYLSGATVTFTGCGNATTTTDATGNFTTPQNCSGGAYTVSGGTDIGTGLPFKGVLKSSFSSTDSKAVASPLTTLVANNPNLNLVALFGLGGNPYTTDPMTDAASLKAAVVVQALISQVSSALQGAGATQQQAADAASKALASVLATVSSTGSTSSLINVANIQAVITSAISTSGVTLPAGTTAASLATGVANQVAAVNTAVANIQIGANPAATLAALQAGGVTSAVSTVTSNAALTNYIQLGSVTLNNGNPTTLAMVQASTTTPITVAGGLSDVKISMTGKGTYANSTQTVDAGFKYTTNGNTVNVVIKGVQLTFGSTGALTAATVPVGASYSFSLAGASTASATLTNKTADNLFSAGNVDLSIPTFLSKLSGAASLSSSTLAQYTPASGVVTTASITMAGSTTTTNTVVSVGDGSGSPVTGVSVTAGSTTVAGSGVNVSVN